MNISITEKEFDAICFAINQVETEIEAADEEFANDAGVYLDHLHGLCKKYKTAREKANNLKLAKGYIMLQRKDLSKSDVEKMARKLIKKVKDETE